MDITYVKGKRDITELVMTVLVPLLAGILSFLVVKNHSAVYVKSATVNILPPIFIFPILWAPVLFLMGLASYRIKLAAPKAMSHVYYAVSLLVAFIWNALLFRFGELTSSFLTIIILLFFLVLTFFEFEKADKRAGRLMLPALIWVGFLAAVNFFLCKGHGVF